MEKREGVYFKEEKKKQREPIDFLYKIKEKERENTTTMI
jgi:hypothetical protein